MSATWTVTLTVTADIYTAKFTVHTFITLSRGEDKSIHHPK